jgi:hypothetical protein
MYIRAARPCKPLDAHRSALFVQSFTVEYGICFSPLDTSSEHTLVEQTGSLSKDVKVSIPTNNDIGRSMLPSIAGYNLFSGETTDPDLMAAALYFWYESRSNNPRTGIAIKLPTSSGAKVIPTWN